MQYAMATDMHAATIVLLATTFVSMVTASTDIQHETIPVVKDKILLGPAPILSSPTRSRIQCASWCREHGLRCLGANVRRLSDGSLWCEIFWVTLNDLTSLTSSPGDVYLNPQRTNYFASVSTGLAGFSSTCAMCLCRESGCEERIGICVASGDVCGPFGIRKAFYCDANYIDVSVCDSSLTVTEAFRNCTVEFNCAVDTLIKYHDRYDELCYTAAGTGPDCSTYVMAHIAGPFGCASPTTADWYTLPKGRIEQCCANHGGCD